MALTRDRNSRDDVVPRDPPQESGILYPSDDDEPMADTELQYHAITNAVFALKMHLQQLGRASTVRGNCALYYDADNRTAYLTPNVLLAYEVAVPGEEGYAPWVYGKVPDLVMEMASPFTHDQDSGLKWERYAALGIPEYWQHDPHHQYLTEDLLGWQLQDGTYVPIPLQPDRPRGALIGRSSVLDTDWGLDMATGILRLWNPVQRRWYPTVQEVGRAHEREAARADQEATRANREATRADRESARANQEAARVREAEAEIARLQVLLQQQGHTPKDPLD
ncbi:MAG: Uma2 family endonuclease [Caldilineaceae bacterium]|nr:Uma2 family endonuclease [Caldilineaceae bacterium]